MISIVQLTESNLAPDQYSDIEFETKRDRYGSERQS